MATITLTDNLLRFDQGSLMLPRTVVETRSTTGVLTQRRGDYTRRIFRGRLIATNRNEVNYIRGVLQPAIDNADQIRFTLPTEFVQYDGERTNPLFVRSDVAADSNTLTISTSSSANSPPPAEDLEQGNYIQFGTDTSLYVINSYTATGSNAGRLIVHPRLRQAVDVSVNNTVTYDNLLFQGHVTSAIEEEIFNGVTTALRMRLIVEETL